MGTENSAFIRGFYTPYINISKPLSMLPAQI
jgi:hypothetical protein